VARIALVHDTAGVAGVQARLLREAGHEVDQIALPEIGASWRWPAKAFAIPLRLAAYLPAIGKLRSNHYDVVHIHWLSQGVVGLLLGRPFFAQAHGSDLLLNMRNPTLRMVTRAVLKKAKIVFYVTPDLVTYAPGFEDKFLYLPNAVQVHDPAEPAPTKLARALIFTQLHTRKGVEQIFPAVERLSRSVEVTALDYGPLAGEYMHRYGGTVRFVQPVPHEQIGSFLTQFDIVIGQMKQGSLGLSELEAMAAGRPVITGLHPSNYRDDPPPVIAASRPDDIAAAVERLRDDQVELARLSREGRDWVRRNHSFARNLQLLEAAYFGPAESKRAAEEGPAPMSR
jgi:glycosyltransferase involved in cell wall biosynthesis